MKTAFIAAALGAAIAAAITCTSALAQAPAPTLPATLAWSAYDVGSGGYNQAVAIGNALKQKYNVSLRVLPGKNDVSRTLPVKAGQVQFSANGVGGSYLAQEGVYEFGVPDWGPQPVRALMLNTSDQVLTVVAAKDSGVKTVADLKGKRVAWVIGARVAARAVLRQQQLRRVEHLQPRLLAASVLVRVVRDRQHPHQHVASLVELLPMRQRPFQRALHQVVGLRSVVGQRARVASQPR
jgi:TRAP transporter TAXI family solute receptor